MNFIIHNHVIEVLISFEINCLKLMMLTQSLFLEELDLNNIVYLKMEYLNQFLY